mmetsp:Transcript_14748/g.36082  ORF Transcript_14748/g.36082 Transcript_14748/m.36082 type:complete len:652 (+) Transcript_14748:405-2360(+)
MPTNMEEVVLAPPAPHPLDHHRSLPHPPVPLNTTSSTDGPSSQQDSAPSTKTETKDTTSSDNTGGAAPTEKKNSASTERGCSMDRCSGCNASNVPLLACDNNLLDQEKQHQQKDGEDGQQRQRFCPDCMIGKNVRVFWPVDSQWYIGEVQQYDRSTGEHLLKYEDGDTEWVMIGESNTTNVAPPAAVGGTGSSTAGGNNSSVPSSRTGTPLQLGGGRPIGGTSAAGHHDSTTSALVDSMPPISPAPGHLLDQRMDSPRTFHHMYGGGGGGIPRMPGVDPSGLLPPGTSTSAAAAAVTPDDKWQNQQEAREARMNSQYMTMGYPSYPPPPYGSYPPPPHGYNPYHYPPMPPQSHMDDLAPGGGNGPSKHTGFHSLGIRDATPSPAPVTAGINISQSSAGGKRKNGPKAWTKEEDSLLLSIVQSMKMPMKWSVVAQQLPERTGKQCRERYVNHLNPRLKVTDWTPLEDATIFHLYNTMGSHWAKMSKIIPGRTDNGIKNRFHNLRRQLEREDEHRLRLSAARDFPDEIRLELVREFPEELRGKSADLWDIKSGLSVLAAQSVLGGGVSRNAGRFGPFKVADNGDVCIRCGFMLPSIQTGTEICTKTGWCQTCARIPPHMTGAMLRECLNLRRCQDEDQREIIESWDSGKRPSQ